MNNNDLARAVPAPGLRGFAPEPAAQSQPEALVPSRDDVSDDYDGYGGDIGCVHCSFDGWHHTCCDDLCRGCNEPEWCESGGRPCQHCNPYGEGL
jgi:hypothetical protein